MLAWTDSSPGRAISDLVILEQEKSNRRLLQKLSLSLFNIIGRRGTSRTCIGTHQNMASDGTAGCADEHAEARMQSLIASLELVLAAWDRQISASRKGLNAVTAAERQTSTTSYAAQEAEKALCEALAASKEIESRVAELQCRSDPQRSDDTLEKAARQLCVAGDATPELLASDGRPESCSQP